MSLKFWIGYYIFFTFYCANIYIATD